MILQLKKLDDVRLCCEVLVPVRLINQSIKDNQAKKLTYKLLHLGASIMYSLLKQIKTCTNFLDVINLNVANLILNILLNILAQFFYLIHFQLTVNRIKTILLLLFPLFFIFLAFARSTTMTLFQLSHTNHLYLLILILQN